MLGTARSTIHPALAALAVAGLIAAGCGGDGDGGGGVASVDGGGSGGGSAETEEASAEEAEQELLDWVECMRDEGIDIADPTRDEDGNLVINGPGIRIGGGSGAGVGDGPPEDGDAEPIDPEAMDAAIETCGTPPRLGGGFSEEDRQQMEEDALAFAECMRDEGIEDFPDPDFSSDGPGGPPQDHGSDAGEGDDGGESGEGGDGPRSRVVLGPFGEIDMDDPEVAAAFEQCQGLMGRHGGGPGGTGGVGPDGSGGGDGGSDESARG
jgi:hypothetical protein